MQIILAGFLHIGGLWFTLLLMQVLLDGQPVVIDRPSLAVALAAGQARAQAAGRIIVEATADGVVLEGASISSPPDTPSTIRELKLVSADPRALVRGTLLDAAAALDAARDQQSMAAEAIQAGKPEQSLEPIQRALATWQAVREIVARGGELLHLDPATLPLKAHDGKTDFRAATSGLIERLTQVRDALAAQDWAALSDVLAYDLDDQSRIWASLLRALAEYLASPAGEAP